MSQPSAESYVSEVWDIPFTIPLWTLRTCLTRMTCVEVCDEMNRGVESLRKVRRVVVRSHEG